MKNILLITLIAIIIFGYFRDVKKTKLHNSNIIALNDNIEIYKTKNDEIVASKQSIVINIETLKQANDSLKEIINNFKKPDIVIRYKWKLKTDTIYVPLIATEKLGKYEFKWSDKWMKLSGIVNENKIKISPLEIINEQNIVTGMKRKNFLSKKQYFVDIINTNPYLKHQSITTYKVDVKKSFHEKWWVTIPTGIFIGTLINN